MTAPRIGLVLGGGGLTGSLSASGGSTYRVAAANGLPTSANLTLAASTLALGGFLAANPETFNVPGRVSFAQVYLDPARRGPRLEADAKARAEG